MLVLIAVGLVLAFVLPLVLAVTVVALAAAATDAATDDDADEPAAAAAATAEELTEWEDATDGGADDADAVEEWPPDAVVECATLDERCLLPASRAERRFDMVISWCLHCSEASKMDETQMEMGRVVVVNAIGWGKVDTGKS